MNTSNPNWFNATCPEQIIPTIQATAHAKRMLELTRLFYLTQGPCAGDRFGEHILPWQEKAILAMFSGDNIKEVAIKIGKGSGKSVLVAAIATACIMDWAKRGENTRAAIMIVAANVKSADIVAQHIIEGISFDDHLRDEFKLYVARRSIIHKDSGITIQVIPPQLSSAVGVRPVLVIADEIHEAAKEREFSEVIDQLRRGGQNWPNYLQLGITTAPTQAAKGYYSEWLARARAVRDGKVTNNQLLPILFEFPVKERPELELNDPNEFWRGMPSLITDANPNGTMHADAMIRELEEALIDSDLNGAGSMQLLLSQRLGIEAEDRVGGGLTPLAEFWDDHAIKVLKPPEKDTPLFIAMDPSSGIDDPFAVVLLYELNDVFYIKSREYLTREGLSRANNHNQRIYDKAQKAGELILCATAEEIQVDVLGYCNRLKESHDACHFGGDAAGLSGFRERFESEVDDYDPVSQGWKLAAAFESAVGYLHGGKIKHSGQPLLTENIKNLRIDGNRLKKADGNTAGQGFSKIDGAMAMLSAVDLQSRREPELDCSYWIA